VCAPESAIATRFRTATEDEARLAERVTEVVARQPGITTGKLAAAVGGADRDEVEAVLGGLVRAGRVRLEEGSFERDGRTVRFSRVYAGEKREAPLVLAFAPDRGAKRKKNGATAGGKREKRPATPDDPLIAELKAWRLREAARQRKPAFKVLTDKAIEGVAQKRPKTIDELLGIAGFGPASVLKYGRSVLRIVEQAGSVGV
jgi:superfamily II DNA helicase RecQ